MVAEVYPTILVLLALSCGSGGSDGTLGSNQSGGSSSGTVIQATGGSTQTYIATGGTAAATGGTSQSIVGGSTSGTANSTTCGTGYATIISSTLSILDSRDSSCTQTTVESRKRMECISPNMGQGVLTYTGGPCSTTNVYAKCEGFSISSSAQTCSPTSVSTCDDYSVSTVAATGVFVWYTGTTSTLDSIRSTCTLYSGTLTVM